MARQQFTTRILSGSLRYRVIKQPGEGTRPISQKVRGAIFSSLGNDLSGLSVLDLYAGSGALGFEALSLGAEHIDAIESGRIALQTLRENTTDLELDANYKVHGERVEQFLARTQATYNIIFFDPPYAEFNADVAAKATTCLEEGGVLVVSCSSREELPAILGDAELKKARTYGDTQIAYYKRK